MAVLDDELMQDAQFDAEVIEFVRQQLPVELKEKFDDETLYYFHDLLEEYLAESDVFESVADEEGYVNIDVEVIAEYMQKKAAKEGVGNFDKEDLLLVADAELSFGDDFEE